MFYVVEGLYYGKWLPITPHPVDRRKALDCRFQVQQYRDEFKLEPRPMRIVPVREEDVPCI